MTPQERLDRADRVKAMLSDGVLNDAVMAVNDELTRAIVESPSEQKEERERLYFEIRALKRVMAKVKSWHDDGLMAEQE